MKGADGTIALRIPAHAGLQQLLVGCEGLFSTSANKTGEPVLVSLDELDLDIRRQVAALVDDYPGNCSKETVPSTILDCSGDTIRVVREGAYPIAELLETIK